MDLKYLQKKVNAYKSGIVYV